MDERACSFLLEFSLSLAQFKIASARFSPRLGLCSLCRDWLGRRTALVWRLPVPSSGQTIEIQEDDGRGVERQELAQRQPANDGVTERLAYLGSGSSAKHERHGAEHRRHRRHENRAETLDASLIDRLLRRETLLALGMKGEVDHHDPVLLDDADQQEDADDGDHAQIEAKRHQQQDRPDSRGWQGRQNGDRVDGAFVENAQDEINDNQSRGDQERRARQGLQISLAVSLKAGLQRQRLAQLLLDLLNGSDGFPERGSREQVVRDRNRWKLALMIDHQRRYLDGAGDEGSQRHLLAGR